MCGRPHEDRALCFFCAIQIIALRSDAADLYHDTGGLGGLLWIGLVSLFIAVCILGLHQRPASVLLIVTHCEEGADDDDPVKVV